MSRSVRDERTRGDESAAPSSSAQTLAALTWIQNADPALLAAMAEALRPYLADAAPRLLNPDEAARALGVTRTTLTRAARADRVVGATRAGKAWRFDSESLQLLPPKRETMTPAPTARRSTTARRTSTTADAIRNPHPQGRGPDRRTPWIGEAVPPTPRQSGVFAGGDH